MMKPIYAMIAAAFVAAIVTVVTAPEPVNAGALPAADAAPMRACAERPWPYLRCVGTQYGNRQIRLVATDRLAAQ